MKAEPIQTTRFRFWLWLIRIIGVIVPRRLRADWKQEWEAELRHRELLLADWDKLNLKTKLDLLRRSLGAFWDALLLQPRRLEDEMFQDLRVGLRMLVKSPAFTSMAVLSLALGIGANTAIFSLVDAVLLKTLPVKNPEQLVFLEQSGAQDFKRSSNISWPAFENLRDHNQALSGICSFSYPTRINASVAGNPDVVEGQAVSGGFFSTLGVDAAAGRLFVEDDDKETGRQPIAVISYTYWKRGFQLNPEVIGQTLVLNRTPFLVVGVTPAEFFGAIVGTSPDLFLPSGAADQILPRRVGSRHGSLPFVLARLKQGVNQQQAGAEVTLLMQQALLAEGGTQLSPEKTQAIHEQRFEAQSAAQGFSGLRQQFSKPLRFLMAAVGLVLLIACANVANLLLARAAARRKEIAVRLALGASRLRLIRQLLTESMLLAAAGGCLGLILAYWCSDLLLAGISSGRNPIVAGSRLFIDVPLDRRILGFTAIVSMVAGMLFGLVPAWRATRLDLSPTLKDKPREVGGHNSRWGRMLVITQVALSLALLFGAGLFTRSLGNLKSLDLGFKRQNILVFSVDPQLIRYRGVQIARLYEQMLERIGGIPGVHSVSLSRQALLNGGGTQGDITVPGRTPEPDEGSITQTGDGSTLNSPYFCQVGPRFFENVGMTILRGRDFGAQDNETSRKVAVVNEMFGRYYFGGEDPLGKRFDRGADNGGEVEIVGVVKDSKYSKIREQVPRTFYVPFLQDPGSWRETTFQVHTMGDPPKMTEAIRQEVHAIDPSLAIFRVRTLEAQIDESLGQERLLATLSGLLGATALLLACAGLYGVLSYSVSRRTHEIGIRMALGAQPGGVLQAVLRETFSLVIIGVAIGGCVSLAAGRLLSSMLFDLTPADPLTLVLAALLMVGVGSLAGYLPARRASRVDPIVALRCE